MDAHRVFLAGLLSLCLVLGACGGGGEAPAEPLPTLVVINAPAQADLASVVTFTSDVANPSGALSLRWEFGDGGSSTEAAPAHRYQAPGDYEVVLTVANEEGASVSGSFTLQVRRSALVDGAACSSGEGRGWCWQRPLPAGNRINDLHFVDARLGWAVGDAGQVLKTDDGGLTWQLQRTPSSSNLTQVRFADAMAGWAVGSSGTLLRTEDGGVTWIAQAPFPPGDGWSDQRITVVDGQRAVAYQYGVIASTQDGGLTWVRSQMWSSVTVTEHGTAWGIGSYDVHKLPLGATESQVVFRSGNERYVRTASMGSETDGLLVEYEWSTSTAVWNRTSNGGRTWSTFVPAGLPSETPYWLKLTGSGHAWTAVNGTLFRSVDAGASWATVALPADASYWSVSDVTIHDERTLGFPHETGYYLSTDAGAHWTLLQVPGDSDWYGELRLWLQGGMQWLVRNDRVHVTTDMGISWRQAFGPAADEVEGAMAAVWFFDAAKGMAVSSAGWLLETTDGGRTWQRRALATGSYTAPRLQFASRSVGWMSGAGGISKTTDGGASWWLPVTDTDMHSISDFHFADDEHGWAIVNGYTVVQTVDGGGNWQEKFSSPYGMHAIHFIDSDVGVMVGSSGAIMRTVDGGATWSLRASDTTAQLLRVTFVDAQHGWAVGDDSAVVQTGDGGLSWQSVPVPQLFGRSSALRDVRFADRLHGWIVGDDGTMLATRDGGQTWALQDSGTSHSLHGAFALDPYTAWAVGESSTVLATVTAGQ